MNNDTAHYKLEDSSIVHETDKAALVRCQSVDNGELEVWFPLSQIDVDEQGEVWVPQWLMDRREAEEEENFIKTLVG